MSRHLSYIRGSLRKICLLSMAALLSISTSFAFTQPAAAVTTTSTQIMMQQLPTNFSRNVLLQLDTTHLEAGRPYLFTGSYGATSPIGSLQAMVMRCHAFGVPSVYSSWSTQNHIGVEYGDSGVQTISGQWLFTPTVSADYVCELVAQAGRVGIPDQFLTVQQPTTKLTLDADGFDYAQEWKQPADARFGNPNSTVMPRPRAVDVLWQTMDVPENTASVRVYTAPEISVESTGGKAPLNVRLTHFVRQLDEAGNYCHITKVSESKIIDNRLHHFKFQKMQEVPLDPNCANKFNVKVYVEYVPATPGTPERHGGVVHNGTYSSGYLVAVPETSPLVFKKNLPQF